jgi:hypothetical protein
MVLQCHYCARRNSRVDAVTGRSPIVTRRRITVGSIRKVRPRREQFDQLCWIACTRCVRFDR